MKELQGNHRVELLLKGKNMEKKKKTITNKTSTDIKIQKNLEEQEGQHISI